MSWQDYVDNQLIASQCVSKACIAGHDGGVWAKSDGFEVSSADDAIKKTRRESPENSFLLFVANRLDDESLSDLFVRRFSNPVTFKMSQDVAPSAPKTPAKQSPQLELICHHVFLYRLADWVCLIFR